MVDKLTVTIYHVYRPLGRRTPQQERGERECEDSFKETTKITAAQLTGQTAPVRQDLEKGVLRGRKGYEDI
ncbi:uncharacterized protein SPSK_06823 [Sporothrix schenckii 1099-18]|uniref:Uncharacterized protein n=1 Tax=Sporothrix schenckii 1099-18 TaxID=1397361 RepID=A0A0F2MK77_SPOSC|nr:uncharacterized protein SPSK_06823 [Sporothrix schenckii 1099-18]KJR90012.1 hypothetical protein SPSK_06823 [Sporothrix schenckii 1099-18]